MGLTERQKQVEKILLTPIEVTKYSNNEPDICLKEHTIFTTQTYKPNPKRLSKDPDMSDIAIGFYQVIYAKEILNKENDFICDCFAGDTMNSFNSMANITPGAGKSKKQRTRQDCWPEELKKYYAQYHCLANFWIVPKSIGRNGKKLNYYDSMDLFLNRIFEEKKYILELGKYKNYKELFETFDIFEDKHFIKGIYTPNDPICYKEDNALKIVKQAITRIQERARILACSNYSENLYEYFKNIGLI